MSATALKHPTRLEFERQARGPSGGGFYPGGAGTAFHIQMPVKANCADGEVFVVIYDEHGTPDGAERVSEVAARREGWRVVLCNSCLERPAKRLDGHFPYDTDFNRCDECVAAGAMAWNRNPDDYPDGGAW